MSSNSLNQKFSDQRLEPITTESNTAITKKKSKSPKKSRFAMLKMVQKSKYKNIFETPTKETKKIEEENETGRERRDVYGNLINKKNRRKVRVTFMDELDEEKPLVSVVKVESYKKYNYIFGMPNENVINKNLHANCQCCITF